MERTSSETPSTINATSYPTLVPDLEMTIELTETTSPTRQISPTSGVEIQRPTVVSTLLPTSRPTVPPTSTATPAATVDRSILAVTVAAADYIDRTCPDPSPARPEYLHYYLSANKWPIPDPSVGEHFWLTKPLPGGGRLLYTDWFPYGYDVNGRYLIHNGLDSAEPAGIPVLAAADGQVVFAGPDQEVSYGWRCNWYGNLVILELNDRWQDKPVFLLYGHVLNIIVEPGEMVTRGRPLAEVGVGGAATLPHLHFEVRVGENTFSSTRNPLLWIKPPTTRGVIAGRLIDPNGRPWQGVAVTAAGISAGTESRTSWTYLYDPEPLINPDEGLAENFVIGDLRPGIYQLRTVVQNETYIEEVDVTGGELTLVEIVTLPLKPATPTPVPEDASG